MTAKTTFLFLMYGNGGCGEEAKQSKARIWTTITYKIFYKIGLFENTPFENIGMYCTAKLFDDFSGAKKVKEV